MTNEELRKKLKELSKQKEQLMNQAHYVQGQIDFINHLINSKFENTKTESSEE